MKKLLQI